MCPEITPGASLDIGLEEPVVLLHYVAGSHCRGVPADLGELPFVVALAGRNHACVEDAPAELAGYRRSPTHGLGFLVHEVDCLVDGRIAVGALVGIDVHYKLPVPVLDCETKDLLGTDITGVAVPQNRSGSPSLSRPTSRS